MFRIAIEGYNLNFNFASKKIKVFFYVFVLIPCASLIINLKNLDHRLSRSIIKRFNTKKSIKQELARISPLKNTLSEVKATRRINRETKQLGK